MKKLYLFFCFFVAINIYGQEDSARNIRLDKKLGKGVQFLGPTRLFSYEVDYFITSNLNLEIGVGLMGIYRQAIHIGFYGGASWYFGTQVKTLRWTPYVGGRFVNQNSLSWMPSYSSFGAYFPLGIQYISAGGFTFAPELAWAYFAHGSQKFLMPNTGIYGAIKLGKHF